MPCHRVVGANGDLTGYGGGLRKKIQLLRSEGVPVRNGKVVVEAFFHFGDLPVAELARVPVLPDRNSGEFRYG